MASVAITFRVFEHSRNTVSAIACSCSSSSSWQKRQPQECKFSNSKPTRAQASRWCPSPGCGDARSRLSMSCCSTAPLCSSPARASPAPPCTYDCPVNDFDIRCQKFLAFLRKFTVWIFFPIAASKNSTRIAPHCNQILHGQISQQLKDH